MRAGELKVAALRSWAGRPRRTSVLPAYAVPACCCEVDRGERKLKHLRGTLTHSFEPRRMSASPPSPLRSGRSASGHNTPGWIASPRKTGPSPLRPLPPLRDRPQDLESGRRSSESFRLPGRLPANKVRARIAGCLPAQRLLAWVEKRKPGRDRRGRVQRARHGERRRDRAPLCRSRVRRSRARLRGLGLKGLRLRLRSGRGAGGGLPVAGPLARRHGRYERDRGRSPVGSAFALRHALGRRPVSADQETKLVEGSSRASA